MLQPRNKGSKNDIKICTSFLPIKNNYDEAISINK